MKKNLITLFLALTAISLTAQKKAPNVMRYFLSNGKTQDVKLSQLEKITKIGTVAIKNIMSDGTHYDFTLAQVDSIVLVYDENEDKPDAGNINRNTDARAMLLEFPRLKGGENNLLVIHSTTQYGITYSLEWDCEKRSQRWTCFQMHNGLPDNKVGRNGGWQDDKLIPKQYRTHSSEYSGTPFSRGHMCASNDRQSSKEQNHQTFIMSNIHPQYQKHNGVLWSNLESKVQGMDRADFRDTLYVVKAGTIDKEDQLLPKTTTGLLVPGYFYMAVLCVKDKQYKAIAFWTKHENVSITNANVADYAISVDELERRTGIDFFCNLPDDIEENVEKTLNVSDWGL